MRNFSNRFRLTILLTAVVALSMFATGCTMTEDSTLGVGIMPESQAMVMRHLKIRGGELIRYNEELGANETVKTGKHVYYDWKPILEKRGALNPLMDPFKMPANQGIIPDYSVDMCPRTLDILSRVVYLDIKPDWTEEDLKAQEARMKDALLAAKN